MYSSSKDKTHKPEMVLGRFFHTRQIDDVEQRNNQSEDPIILISGPPSCGKTSLLFQFAFNSALSSNNGGGGDGHVVFICNRRKLDNKPPYLSQGIDPASDIFRRIQMKYVEDDEGIKRFFAAFHLHQTYPTTVIVDDFGDFFDERTCQGKYNNQRGKDLAMVRTLALCRDAINHANEMSDSRGLCKLLLSDTHSGDTPRLLFIYKRWIPCIFTIKCCGPGLYLLNFQGKKAAKYSIALQYLMLEEITEEKD